MTAYRHASDLDLPTRLARTSHPPSRAPDGSPRELGSACRLRAGSATARAGLPERSSASLRPVRRRGARLRRLLRERRLERETGIEPATNSLEGCDSTTELLPPSSRPRHRASRLDWLADDRAHSEAVTAVSASASACQLAAELRRTAFARERAPGLPAEARSPSAFARFARLRRGSLRSPRAKAGGEGRIRTSEATWATDLQSVAFDRSATSPNLLPGSPDRLDAAGSSLAGRHRLRRQVDGAGEGI